MLIHPSVCPCEESRHRRGLSWLSTLSRNSVLDLAVDSTHLLVEGLLSVTEQFLETLLNTSLGGNLVATLRNNLRVVGRTTTVPGEELLYESVLNWM